MNFEGAESETIRLCICLEAINDIVNHKLLTLRDVSAYPGEAEIWFHTDVHRDLFLIRLLDFVKEKGDKSLTGAQGSCIDVLKGVCETKHLDHNGGVTELQNAVEALEDWLQQKRGIALWLPTLGIEAKLSVSRLELLNISGNYSKHNLSRLTGVSREVEEILKNHGHCVPKEQIPLALDDFREHLSENYFIYYGTWLSELLNNIRWGLQSYLWPTCIRTYKVVSSDTGQCQYEYPANIQTDISKQWFCRLMNNVRARPYIKRFKGAHYLKKESSLEKDSNISLM